MDLWRARSRMKNEAETFGKMQQFTYTCLYLVFVLGIDLGGETGSPGVMYPSKYSVLVGLFAPSRHFCRMSLFFYAISAPAVVGTKK